VPDEFRGKNFVSEHESPATRQLCEEATAQGVILTSEPVGEELVTRIELLAG